MLKRVSNSWSYFLSPPLITCLCFCVLCFLSHLPTIEIIHDQSIVLVVTEAVLSVAEVLLIFLVVTEQLGNRAAQ